MDNDKKILKILFWCISPLLFIAFFRLFWLVFGFVFGGIIYLILGARFATTIGMVSIGTALVFTTLAFRWLYVQYKKYFLNNDSSE